MTLIEQHLCQVVFLNTLEVLEDYFSKESELHFQLEGVGEKSRQIFFCIPAHP